MDTPGTPKQLRAGATSLANLREIIFALLEATAAETVTEIGAFRGELTRDLVRWAKDHSAQVAAIDPAPTSELIELSREHPELELIRGTSFQALDVTPIPDVVILDGDHNYYTVTGELQRVYRAGGKHPLVIAHDVGWPLARRDSYHAPEEIPAPFRQPLGPDRGLSSEPNFAASRPFAHTAEREGGPRNGALTAIEDFMTEHEGLCLAVIPLFFGLGVLWCRDAPWAATVADVVGPLDRHPVLERLEADRVAHLIGEQLRARRITELEALIESKDRALQEVRDAARHR